MRENLATHLHGVRFHSHKLKQPNMR